MIIPAPACTDDAPTRYTFDYWEHDPMEGEPPVTDVESTRFPLPGEPAPLART